MGAAEASVAVERVSMGSLRVLKGAGVLGAYGVGSCVIVMLHDPIARVGGMAHAMLPQLGQRDDNAWKYVDGAIEHLLVQLTQAGADTRRLVARLAGGATMFRSTFDAEGPTVGQRNLAEARQQLHQRGILLAGEEVGGDVGRTVLFDVGTGLATVRALAGQRTF